MTHDRVFVAFGGNLAGPAGTPLDSFVAAATLLARRGVVIPRWSPVYASDPWGGIRQPTFLNGVWEIRSPFGPQQLMRILLQTERRLGRRRRVRWGPRVLDLDLLVFGDLSGIYAEEGECAPALELPHPRMAARAFVLAPLADLAPNLRIPISTGHGHKLRVQDALAQLALRDRIATRRLG